MIYILYKVGENADWDDIRIFTSLKPIEMLMSTNRYYVIAYDTDGHDELVPVCMYQLVKGKIQQFSL